jgi:hypothetical protein
MTGDADKIMNLWRELVGDPAFVPEDLSGIWVVQLGSHTESLQSRLVRETHRQAAVNAAAMWLCIRISIGPPLRSTAGTMF